MIKSMKNTTKKISVLLLAFIVLVSAMSVTSLAAEANKKSFNVSLPHGSSNVTAASAQKVNSKSYGKVQITKIGGGSAGINCWLRSKKSNGEWDPLNSKYRSFTDLGTKTVYYKNSSTGYTIPHSKGTNVQLRMENRTNTQLVKDSVRGYVWFN